MFEVYAGYPLRREPGSSDVESTQAALIGAEVDRRANLIWQEHCSECAMPQCYSSCDYFRPRPDYKCQRLEQGVSLLEPTALTVAPMRLKFGRWARLLAYGPRPLVSVEEALRQERGALRRAGAVGSLAVSRALAAPIRRRFNKRLSDTSAVGWPDTDRLFFVLETFVEGPTPVDLVLSARLVDEHDVGIEETYRARLSAEPGHRAVKIPLRDILGKLPPGQRFCLELAPTGEDERPELGFGLMDVVELDVPGPVDQGEGAGPLKCVVWDLDNTLWNGTLIEDGASRLTLRPGVRDLIESLDQKGVLQSLASKNNAEEAMEVVASFGLADYFLVPRISWGPKSQAIAEIAEALNIGIDSLAFVDDQPFERAEVGSVHPAVLVLDPEELGALADHSRLQYEVTEESRMRRSMYRAELDRERALGSSSHDYDGFLASCEIEVTVAPLAEGDARRAHELAQRTNQLNLSTTRYSRDQIDALTSPDSALEAFTVRAEDRFGSYGLVGFCVYDPASATILDLMFSCRIQSKLVDDVFVAWLGDRHGRGSDRTLRARFTPSDRNSPAKQLIERAGFRWEEEADGYQIWLRSGEHRGFAELAEIVTVSAPGTR